MRPVPRSHPWASVLACPGHASCSALRGRAVRLAVHRLGTPAAPLAAALRRVPLGAAPGWWSCCRAGRSPARAGRPPARSMRCSLAARAKRRRCAACSTSSLAGPRLPLAPPRPPVAGRQRWRVAVQGADPACLSSAVGRLQGVAGAKAGRPVSQEDFAAPAAAPARGSRPPAGRPPGRTPRASGLRQPLGARWAIAGRLMRGQGG